MLNYPFSLVVKSPQDLLQKVLQMYKSVSHRFIWDLYFVFRHVYTYSILSSGQRSKQNRLHCWCRRSTPPYPLFSPPWSPRHERLSLLTNEFFLKVVEGGHLWTSIFWVSGNLENNKNLRNIILKSYAMFLEHWDGLTNLYFTLYFKLHLCNRWTWTDVNIMKLLHNLR